jgi:VanZ family protein
LLPEAHFLSFFALAAMILSIRWPMPRWGIVPSLVVYAGMTEVLQGFFPPRTPEWMDWFQDLAGIAVGATFCWTAALAATTLSKSRWSPSRISSPPADDWESLQKIVHQPVAVEPSWWG